MERKELLILIGKRIVQLRTENRITQAELTRRCDKDRSWLARIESGRTNPTITTLNLIAEALEVSLEEITRIE